MDRDDARLVAHALDCRIAGARAELERLAASSLMRLSASAGALRKRAGDWPPAHAAADDLMAICRTGGAVCDTPTHPELKKVVDSLRALAAEPARQAPRNRAERRAQVRLTLPRLERLQGRAPARLH